MAATANEPEAAKAEPEARIHACATAAQRNKNVIDHEISVDKIAIGRG